MNAKLRVVVVALPAVIAGCATGPDPATRELIEQQSAALHGPDMEPTETASTPEELTTTASTATSGDFSRIRVGMSDTEVREILANPDDENVGLSGRAFNPFYWGPNQQRATWTYKGKGRIVFDRNMYNGRLRVVRVIANPSE